MLTIDSKYAWTHNTTVISNKNVDLIIEHSENIKTQIKDVINLLKNPEHTTSLSI